MPSTSSLIAVGWSPFGSYSDLITKRTPPSDFSRRGGRCGVQTLTLAVLALEFGAAVADQAFQRVGGGGDAERFHLVARRPRQRASSSSSSVVKPSCCASSGSSVGDRGRRAVVGLRGFLEALLRSCASATSSLVPRFGRARARCTRGLAAGAAIRGVRRRLQAGARAHAGIAAVDREIEQFHASASPIGCTSGRCALDFGVEVSWECRDLRHDRIWAVRHDSKGAMFRAIID